MKKKIIVVGMISVVAVSIFYMKKDHIQFFFNSNKSLAKQFNPATPENKSKLMEFCNLNKLGNCESFPENMARRNIINAIIIERGLLDFQDFKTKYLLSHKNASLTNDEFAVQYKNYLDKNKNFIESVKALYEKSLNQKQGS